MFLLTCVYYRYLWWSMRILSALDAVSCVWCHPRSVQFVSNLLRHMRVSYWVMQMIYCLFVYFSSCLCFFLHTYILSLLLRLNLKLTWQLTHCNLSIHSCFCLSIKFLHRPLTSFFLVPSLPPHFSISLYLQSPIMSFSLHYCTSFFDCFSLKVCTR